MKFKIKKNINQRYFFKKNEKNRLILKVLSKNLKIKKNIRWTFQQKFFNFFKKSSLTYIKNICILTGRSRSIYRFSRLSRIEFRRLASKGELPGFFKYSW